MTKKEAQKDGEKSRRKEPKGNMEKKSPNTQQKKQKEKSGSTHALVHQVAHQDIAAISS